MRISSNVNGTDAGTISTAGNTARVAELSLRSGLSLMATKVDGTYRLGTPRSSLLIKNPLQLRAVQLLAKGVNPFRALISAGAPLEDLNHLERFISELHAHNLLLTERSAIALPTRYLAQIHHRDLAAQQLLARSSPEKARAQWSAFDKEGDGAVIVSERARHRILISGRSRVATLIYTLLSQSGFSAVEFIDEDDRPAINDLDIGVAAISAAALGGNYYQEMREHHRNSALFPHAQVRRGSGKVERISVKPSLIIHTGMLDIDLLVDWMTSGQPHMVIYPPIGDEVLMGPIVLPTRSPCNRCCELYELDHDGFTRTQRIALDSINEVSVTSAHFIAALASAQVMRFIDTGEAVGEISYLDLTELHRRQVVTLARHPLCGCSDLRSNHLT